MCKQLEKSGFGLKPKSDFLSCLYRALKWATFKKKKKELFFHAIEHTNSSG
jgi:hypothetical protein